MPEALEIRTQRLPSSPSLMARPQISVAAAEGSTYENDGEPELPLRPYAPLVEPSRPVTTLEVLPPGTNPGLDRTTALSNPSKSRSVMSRPRSAGPGVPGGRDL